LPGPPPAGRPHSHRQFLTAVTVGQFPPCQRYRRYAELRGDAGRLSALLADDFLSIGEQGFQFGKREWIDRHRDFQYLAIETTEVDVRRHDKTAIVRCVQRSRASWRGDPMALAVRLTQVWIRQADG